MLDLRRRIAQERAPNRRPIFIATLWAGPKGMLFRGRQIRSGLGRSQLAHKALYRLVRIHETIFLHQILVNAFLLFRQGEQLREHARAKGVHLIGDLPFFVSPDSRDVWANPELFLLDDHPRPRFVAGVPPEYFSAKGQLWGNPVYNWEALRRTRYRSCIDRLRALLTHVDAVRLDHFRGFAVAWHVPAGAKTAQSGQWVPGPGVGNPNGKVTYWGTRSF